MCSDYSNIMQIPIKKQVLFQQKRTNSFSSKLFSYNSQTQPNKTNINIINEVEPELISNYPLISILFIMNRTQNV